MKIKLLSEGAKMPTRAEMNSQQDMTFMYQKTQSFILVAKLYHLTLIWK